MTERSHEISLLRLIGFTQGKLRGFLYGRALLLTLAAYCLGWVILDIYYYYRNMHSLMGFAEAQLKLILTPSSSLLGLGLAMTFAFLGVWLTSRRMATQSPITGSD
jgi:ABC-type antimicrobial peptide transport system permease subunit